MVLLSNFNQMKISACIITFNEERNIERCLKSLQGVADEIVVIDSFSKDATEEICKKYNVVFKAHPFEGHVEQKNVAMNAASNDIVLALDADEALTKELKASILKIKKEGMKADAYCFNRLNNYCGKWVKHSGWYPDRKTRLWDKRKGKWGGDNPHDKVIMEQSGEATWIKGDLLHYSYYSIQGHHKQMGFFTDIMAESNYKKGKRSSLFKIIVNPIFSFFRAYVLKLGFLDGTTGFVLARMGAHYTFLKYLKILEIQQEKKGKNLF